MSIDRTKSARHCMRVARVHPDLPLGIHEPKRHGDVGWDLEAMEDVWIPPMQAVDVPVNASVELPEGTWAEIRPRSSISRMNLQVDAGTIDNGYRGRLFVLVRNMRLPMPLGGYNGIEGFDEQSVGIQINQGERIAQLVLYRMAPAWIHEVPMVDVTTDRSTAGFGSTGR